MPPMDNIWDVLAVIRLVGWVLLGAGYVAWWRKMMKVPGNGGKFVFQRLMLPAILAWFALGVGVFLKLWNVSNTDVLLYVPLLAGVVCLYQARKRWDRTGKPPIAPRP